MIHVVAAAVMDAAGRVLIAQRPPGKHLAGRWEFPGGKLESDEAPAAALARELHEELGIRILHPRPLMRVRHRYEFDDVLIDMWVVKQYDIEPRGLEGQGLQWCLLEELPRIGLLAADVPIIPMLRLPERLDSAVSTVHEVLELDDANARPLEVVGSVAYSRRLRGIMCATFEEAAAVTLNGIADFIVVRGQASAEQIRSFCGSICAPVFVVGCSLEKAWTLGATGIHTLTRARSLASAAR